MAAIGEGGDVGIAGDAEQSGAAGAGKGSRKTLEEQLADAQAQERKIREKIKQRDKAARLQYEKDLADLLKTNGFDQVPIEVWRRASPAVAEAFKKAAK